MKMNERIHVRRKGSKLIQAVLAKLVGMNRVTVTGRESGDYEPGGSNPQALAVVLKCNPRWPVSGNDDSGAEVPGFKLTKIFGIKKIPVLSQVQAGEWTESGQSIIANDVNEWVYTTANLCDEGFALKARGNSMTNSNGVPSIPEGSLVVTDPDYRSTYEANGKIVVAQIMGSIKATLKKFVIDGPTKYLVPLSSSY